MLIPNDKLKVFVSSICGTGKDPYNVARAMLKRLIEDTQLATVYLFEDQGASSLSAGQHYIYGLEDSDVCIFFIDNKDGVTSGVQKEIDTANKHRIKSIYYFCDKDSKEETPLQTSMKGPEFPKSKVVHSFEEFIKNGAQSLIDEIIDIYRNYCKRRLIDKNENEEPSKEGSISDDYFKAELICKKEIIANVDTCKNYFAKLIFNQNTNIEKTDAFDELCYKFIAIMFEGKSILDFNQYLYLQALKKRQSLPYYEVIKKRWDAIQSYFLGNLEKCVEFLEEALKLSKENELPDWFTKDILIDLRNQRSRLNESKNVILIKDDAQEELSKSEHLLYYPLLDRFVSNLYKTCFDNEISEIIKSPYTVTWGNDNIKYLEDLTNYFIVSMFNGSLTHLLLVYEKISYLLIHLCEKYGDWHLKVLLLKMFNIRQRSKETDGFIEAYPDILSKMNDADALEIFSFTDNVHVHYLHQISKFEAFRITGYFLSDEDFERISKIVIKEINVWLDAEEPCRTVGEHFLEALSAVAYRIDLDELVLICCKVINKGFVIWYDKIFKLISNFVDINMLQKETLESLFEIIYTFIYDEKRREHANSFKHALINIRKANNKLTETMNERIKEQMPLFYEDVYCLETTEKKQVDMPLFIEKYLEEIEDRNLRQGENGTYTGYFNRPYITIKRILQETDVIFEDILIDRVFISSSNTLLEKRQTIEDKHEALELLIFLCKKHPETIQRNENIVRKIKENKNIIESGYKLMTNLSEDTLCFAALFFYECLGEMISIELLEFSNYLSHDLRAQISASKTICDFLEADEKMALNPTLEIVIFQYALSWCNSTNTNVRWHAVKILVQLLRNKQYGEMVCNQLIKFMDTDNFYIKNLILREAKKLKNVDEPTYEYILQKASLDHCYVVRKVYQATGALVPAP